MTLFSNIEANGQTSAPPKSAETLEPDIRQFAVDETYWGYIVRSTESTPVPILMLQIVAWGVGISFCLATLGLWLLPSAVLQGPVLGMKLGASVVTTAAAAFCFWFASRGTASEIQIDTKLGEIREVVRNRAGRATLIGRYGFDAIGGLEIEYGVERRQRGVSEGELVLCYRNSEQKLHVARGAMARLAGLRDRIGRDLMLTSRMPRPSADAVAA